MANPLDLLSSEGLDSAKPVAGLDLLPEGPGAFKRGLGAGAAGVKSSLWGAGALAARGATAVLPAAAAPITQGLEAAALENAAAQNEIAASQSMRYEDVLEDPMRSAEYFKFLLGQAVPSLATMAVGGGLGALAGRAVAGQAAVRAGALTGAVAPDVALEAGSIYPEALKEGVESPGMRAAVGGAAAGALDFVPLLAAEKYLKPIGKGGLGALARGAVKGAPVGAGLEGSQEMLQSLVERAAAGKSLTDPAAVSDYIESFLGGAAPGSVFGAAIGARRQSTAPVQEPAPLTNPEQPPEVNAPPVDTTPLPPATPAERHAQLTAEHTAATQQLAALEPAVAAAQQAHDAALARREELTAEAKLPIGERRTMSEITVEKKAIAKQIESAKKEAERLGGELYSTRATIAGLTPQLEAAARLIAPSQSESTEVIDQSQSVPNVVVPDEGLNPAITPKVEVPVSDVVATSSAPVVTEQEHINRAVVGVQTLMRERGMLHDLPASQLGGSTDSAQSVRQLAIERQGGRGATKGPSSAQMAAIEPHAMSVIEPIAMALAKTKTDTPGGQAKIAKAMTASMRSVVQEAAKLQSVEAAQAYITDKLPKALKGHGVQVDAPDMAKAVSAAVGQAKTQFSKGAVEHPRAGVEVDGLVVRKSVPNTGSISASFSNYREQPGIRSVPIASFEDNQPPKNPDARTKKLAADIAASGEINPLIVALDKNGPYILEGAHRFDALKLLGKKEFPAVVVEDHDPGMQSNAALTQDEFDTLPEPAKFAAVDEFNKIMREKGTRLRERLLQLIGHDSTLKISTFMATPDSPIGSYTRVGPLKSVITLALNAKDELSIADHEGYHYAEDRLMDARERRIVANALKKGRPIFNQLIAKLQAYDQANGTNLTDEVSAIPAEARAYAFEFWRRGELKAEGPLIRIWTALRTWLEKVRNLVTGLGFTSIDDVFTALDRGQFAERTLDSGQITEGAGESQTQSSKSADYTQTPEFKKWFGDSKVVDAEGKPLVVYHGTNRSFNSFDPEQSREGDGMIFVTPNQEVASNFALYRTVWGGANVMPLYVKADKVLVIDGDRRPIREVESRTQIDGMRYGETVREFASRSKYDAIQFKNVTDDMGPRIPPVADVFALLPSAQIKSAIGNTGAFDPTNPDIRFSRGAGNDPFNPKPTGLRSAIKTARAASGGYGVLRKKLQELHDYVSGEFTESEVRRLNDEISNIVERIQLADPTKVTPLNTVLGNALDAINSEISDVFAVGRLRQMFPQDSDTRFSRGAVATATRSAFAEMTTRFQNGELEREQYFLAVTKLMDQAKTNIPTVREMAAAVGDEAVGAFTRARTYLATGNYIGKSSKGYKNVLKALSAQEQYKDRLIADGSEVGLSKWHDATQEDREVTFNALLKRRIAGYLKGSPEFNALMEPLTPSQRAMFAQVAGDKDNEGVIAKFLHLEFGAETEAFRRIMTAPEFEQWQAERAASVQGLIDNGYVPERRYGDHTVKLIVDVVDAEGKVTPTTVAREQFETGAQARVRTEQYAAEIKAAGSNVRVEQGIMHSVERDSDLSLQQVLDLTRRQGIRLGQVEIENLSRALLAADSMRRNRMMRSDNVPGYSRNGWRVLNEWVTGMSGRVAHSTFSSTVNDALDGKPVTAYIHSDQLDGPSFTVADGQPVVSTDTTRNLWEEDGPKSGFYRDLADKRSDLVLRPQDSSVLSTKLKATAMSYFIGGSLGGGMVQMFSVPMNTLPYLSQHTDYTNAFSTTLSAWSYTLRNAGALRDLNKLKDPNFKIEGLTPELRQALILAAQDGTNSSTEIHQIMGISRGGLLSQSRTVQRALDVWMAPFKFGENTSRVAAFIAAWNIGIKEKKLSGRALYEFAKTTVDETQNRYDPVNRPTIASHPIGSLLFMFRSFPLFVVEMVETMFRQNPKSAVYMLLGLVALTGVQGLPFAEDILDIVDVISQKLFGSPFNSRRAMRNMLKDASEAMAGVDLSNLFMRGLINDMIGLNFATRVGGGDMIPGTRLGAADMDYGRAVEQILGAPISMVVAAGGQIPNLVGGVLKGDVDQILSALRAGGPVAVRNLIKGVEQMDNGFALDARGRRLNNETTGLEALWQSIGVSSAALTKIYDLDAMDRQTTAFYTQVSADMQARLIRALRDGDTEKAQEIYEARTKWNTEHPDMPLMPNAASTRRGIMMAGVPLNERTLRMMPRALRGSSVANEASE